MLNHNHDRPEESATAVVIEMFGKKRARPGKKVDELNTPPKAQEARTTLAKVMPIKGGRRRSGSRGD